MGAYGPPLGFYCSKPRVQIHMEHCTGCMSCIEICRIGNVLHAYKMDDGSIKAEVKRPDECAGCGRCVSICPTHAIGMYLV